MDTCRRVVRLFCVGALITWGAVWGQQPADAGKPGRDADLGRQREPVPAVGVVKIERPEGVCYWSVVSTGDIVRLPVEVSGFSAVLLSAEIDGDYVRLSVAGEARPLDTTILGRFNFGSASAGSSEKALIREEARIGDGVWRFRLLTPAEFSKGGLDDCCSCGGAVLKVLACCPAMNKCITCGTCGECCLG